jgi:SAM-dependent methyltransferase
MTEDGPVMDAYLSGAISAPVALMRLLLPGTSAAAVTAALERQAAAMPDAAAGERMQLLLDLARQHRDGLRLLERMVQADAAHGGEADPATAIAASRAVFDRLVAISPEASVAAYTLGDAGLLRAATDGLVGWLERQDLLSGRPAVLDLGCGIGRLAAALAPHAAEMTGLDVSPGMIAAARERCGGHGNLRFAIGSGHDLAGVADASCDLVLAVDVFPYLVVGGLALAARHVAEAGRVLRSRGSLVILNFSYREDAADRRDVAALAAQSGFTLLRNGTRELALWDGAAYWLRLAR